MLLSNLNLLATAPGGVARLRELILTLAVQGKLVPQDPKDEPASELLKKIRAEKDRLIAEGKIKRDKPLAAIAEEEKPFALPSGWEWVRLATISEFTNGFAFPSAEFSSDATGVGIVKIGDIQNGVVSVAGMSYVSQRYASSVDDAFRVEPGDMLIAMSGATTGKLGFNRQSQSFLLNQRVGKIALYLVHQAYVHQYLTTKIAENLSISAGSAIPNLSTVQIKEIAFPLPPLAEQTRIVTRVEELMRLCDALEAKGQLETTQHAQLVSTLLSTLTESETPAQLTENWYRIATHFDLLLVRPQAVDALEQTILQLAVRGLLVPQDPQDEPASKLLKKIRAEKDKLIAEGKIKRDKPMPPIAEEEQPFTLPQGWGWVRFDELTHPLKPIAYGVLVPGPDLETGVSFVRIADLSLTNPPSKPEKSIGAEVDAQFPRTRLEGGEILMGVVGSIGKLGIAPSTWAGANIARAICRIVPADTGLSEYVLLLLQTEFMQCSFAGDTRTLAQPTLNIGLIRQALTPIPPPAEQSRIVTRVAQLRRLCADLRQRLSASQSTQAHLAEALVENVA